MYFIILLLKKISGPVTGTDSDVYVDKECDIGFILFNEAF
jgi:hypothetical protein